MLDEISEPGQVFSGKLSRDAPAVAHLELLFTCPCPHRLWAGEVTLDHLEGDSSAVPTMSPLRRAHDLIMVAGDDYLHRPQEGMNDVGTRSPGARPCTSGPTAPMTPPS